MKLLTYILTFMIFSSSLNAGAFVHSASEAFGMHSAESSCMEEKSRNCCSASYGDESKDGEEEGCCTGSNCDCTCCMHVVYYQNFVLDNSYSMKYPKLTFTYELYYSHLFLSSVFHPPLQ